MGLWRSSTDIEIDNLSHVMDQLFVHNKQVFLRFQLYNFFVSTIAGNNMPETKRFLKVFISYASPG